MSNSMESAGYVNNTDKSGSLREKGKNEPNISDVRHLSEAELAVREQNEIDNQKELAFLSHVLNKTEFFDRTWSAEEVLKNIKIKAEVAKKLPPKFRYGKLDTHLRTLAAKEQNTVFRQKTN